MRTGSCRPGPCAACTSTSTGRCSVARARCSTTARARSRCSARAPSSTACARGVEVVITSGPRPRPRPRLRPAVRSALVPLRGRHRARARRRDLLGDRDAATTARRRSGAGRRARDPGAAPAPLRRPADLPASAPTGAGWSRTSSAGSSTSSRRGPCSRTPAATTSSSSTTAGGRGPSTSTTCAGGDRQGRGRGAPPRDGRLPRRRVHRDRRLARGRRDGGAGGHVLAGGQRARDRPPRWSSCSRATRTRASPSAATAPACTRR